MVLDLIVSLPPQMSRYLKDVFGPRVAPLMGMTADELHEMKCSMGSEELAEALTPRVCPLSMELEAFIDQLDGACDLGATNAEFLRDRLVDVHGGAFPQECFRRIIPHSARHVNRNGAPVLYGGRGSGISCALEQMC